MKTQAKCRPLSPLNTSVWVFEGGFCAYAISYTISYAGLNNNVKFNHTAFLLMLDCNCTVFVSALYVLNQLKDFHLTLVKYSSQ